MRKSLKDALIEARELPHGGILIRDGNGYSVEELPEGAQMIVPADGQMPMPLTPFGIEEINTLVSQFVQGRLARATGKKIKRRVTSG